MNFKRERIRDFFLKDTNVENIFINEYMAEAPGDYVKVYLFALMYADYEIPMSNDIIAKHLNLADEDVLKAWSFWEGLGVVKKHFDNPGDKFKYQIEFLNLKERVYGKKLKKTESLGSEKLDKMMNDEEIRDMYSEIERISGRIFQGKEPTEILSWISDYNATPEMIVYAYSYCLKKRGHCKYRYVGAIVKEWANHGLRKINEIEDYLQETDNRHYLYKRVLKALGFTRNSTEEEKRLMDSWFDQMGFNLDKVLEACSKTSGISNPNMNYVHSILKSWKTGVKKETVVHKTEKPNQINRAFKYYEEIRKDNEAKADKRRNEVHEKIPRIKDIDEELRIIGLDISRIMLSGSKDAKVKINSLKKQVEDLNIEKAFLMTENNFTIDYMDVKYNCSQCKDTGVLDTGIRCKCFNDVLSAIEKTD